MRNKYPTIVPKVTYETGKLTLPLYRSELSTILANILKGPIVCATAKGCIPMTLEQLKEIVNLAILPDDSPEGRFGMAMAKPLEGVAGQAGNPQTVSGKPQAASGAVSDRPGTIVIPADPERVKSILSKVELELQDLGIATPQLMNHVRSEETKRYVQDLLSKNKEDAHVVSALVSDALDRILRGQKV